MPNLLDSDKLQPEETTAAIIPVDLCLLGLDDWDAPVHILFLLPLKLRNTGRRRACQLCVLFVRWVVSSKCYKR